MSVTNPESKPFAVGSAGARVLDKTDLLVMELERLLASELHLLASGEVDGLEAIADAKSVLVRQIDSLQPGLIELFKNHAQHTDVLTLKHRLSQCRSDNQNNHALVMLELKHTNKSLELLRSVLMMDDLSLYSEYGQVLVKREKRRFGSA